MDFATKPKLAQRMLERLLAEHGRQAVGWFTADEAYGDNPGLRAWLDEQDINYVMAVSCDARFSTPTGPRRANSPPRRRERAGSGCRAATEARAGGSTTGCC